MDGNWLPEHVDAEPAQPAPRGPLYFLIGSGLVLFVVVAFIFFNFVIGQGRTLGEENTPSSPPPASPVAPASPTPQESESPIDEPSKEPTPARPAPAGAIEATAFTSPAENIHCRINDTNVECSIYAYDYPSPGQCEGITATYSVGAEGEVDAGCQYFVKTNEVHQYGTVIAKNGFACTLEQHDGVTCWSEMSGHGFNLTRSEDTVF